MSQNVIAANGPSQVINKPKLMDFKANVTRGGDETYFDYTFTFSNPVYQPGKKLIADYNVWLDYVSVDGTHKTNPLFLPNNSRQVSGSEPITFTIHFEESVYGHLFGQNMLNGGFGIDFWFREEGSNGYPAEYSSLKYLFKDPYRPKPIPDPDRSKSQTSVFIDGVEQFYEVRPVIVKGTTLVPMRDFFETLGARVDWNGDTRTVKARKGTAETVLTIDQDTAWVNGKSVKLELPPQIIHEKTMVPLRFVSEALGGEVEWKAESNSIYVASKADANPMVDNQLRKVITTNPFEQGAGYEQGAYDSQAVQPTGFNWTRASRFKGPENPEIKWSFNPQSSWLDSSPAIGADGTIYLASASGKLHALNPNGTEKWKFIVKEAEIRSSPVIGKDGTIYIGAFDRDSASHPDSRLCDADKCYKGGLFAIHPDGSLQWRTLFNEELTIASATISKDGTIYIGTGSSTNPGRFYALDANGVIKGSWGQSDRGRNGEGYPGVYSSAAHRNDGMIYAQDVLFDGKPSVKHYAKERNYFSSPAIGNDGTIYFGTYVNTLSALQPDGLKKWQIIFGQSMNDNENRISASPAIKNSTIYIGHENGNLYAVHLEDLAKAKYQTESIELRWEDFKGDMVFNSYRFDDIAAVNASLNSWNFQTGGWSNSPVVGADGTIFIGNKNNVLYAVTPNGQQKWRLQLGPDEGGVYNQVIGTDSTIYVTSGKTLYAIGEK
jgi:outer membrane protein assembly factor BamB